MINTIGYRKLKDFVDEYLTSLQRADEKYKFDKNLIIQHAINCLIRIGGDIYQKDILPLKLEVNNHTTLLPDTIGIIQGVFKTDYMYSDRVVKLPYNMNPLNITNYLNTESRVGPDCYNYRSEYNESYYVAFPYIHTTFKTGFLLVDYQSIRTDEDGLILFPNYPEMDDALRDYITYELFFEAYLLDDINENKYERLQRKQQDSLDVAKMKNAFLSKEESIAFLSKINRRYDEFKFRRPSNRRFY